MKTYSYVRMLVDGNETKKLDVFHEGNAFHVYEHDENVFTGSWIGTIEYINAWKANAEPLVEHLKSIGCTVEFDQTIK